MRRECPECGLRYYREPGYFIGAMILNYGFTAAFIIGAYLLCLAAHFEAVLHTTRALLLWMLFGVTLSLLLVRHCYSLWLSLDYWIEPWAPQGASQESSEGS